MGPPEPPANRGYVGAGLDGIRRQVAAEVARLERESVGLDANDKAVLELHRESFARLVGSFRVYAPILSQVKNVFDGALDQRMARIFHVQPKTVKLDALKNGYDLNLQAIYDQHELEMKPYKEDLEKLRAANRQLDLRIAEKQAQIDVDTGALSVVKAQLDELEEWQQTLVESMKQWEGELEKINTAADNSEKSVWKTKQGITRAQEKIVLGEGEKIRR